MLTWSFPWSVCQRVGFWCQCIWFGFLCVCESCEVANELRVCSLTGRRFCMVLIRKKWFLILLNCAKLKFVSYTSNISEQMYDFPKNAQCSTRSRFWILKISCQNRSLETVPACIVWQYYPHNNTVCIHMCDGCKISNDLILCHKPWSIL